MVLFPTMFVYDLKRIYGFYSVNFGVLYCVSGDYLCLQIEMCQRSHGSGKRGVVRSREQDVS